MDRIIYDSARQLAEQKTDQGYCCEALEIAEALDAHGEADGLIGFCREMAALERLTDRVLHRCDLPNGDFEEDWKTGHVLGSGGEGITFLVRGHSDRLGVLKLRESPIYGYCSTDQIFPVTRLEDARTPSVRQALLVASAEPWLQSRFAGHPNIAAIEDWLIEQDGGNIQTAIVMEALLPMSFYSGGDVVRLGLDISAALCALHEQRVFHTDVKLDNIFIDRQGRFKLGDFGSAVLVSEGVGHDGCRRRYPFTSRTIPAETYFPVPDYTRDPMFILASFDVHQLGIAMAKLFLRTHPDRSIEVSRVDRSDLLKAEIESNRPLFEASAVGRVVLRLVTSSLSSDFTSATALRNALLEAAAQDGVSVEVSPRAREAVRADYDRFFTVDDRSRLFVKYNPRLFRLFDGNPVVRGDICGFFLSYGDGEPPCSVTITRRETLGPDQLPRRPYRPHNAVSVPTEDSWQEGIITLDRLHFEACDQADIHVRYPDGYECHWKVEFTDKPVIWNDPITLGTPPTWLRPDGIGPDIPMPSPNPGPRGS